MYGCLSPNRPLALVSHANLYGVNAGRHALDKRLGLVLERLDSLCQILLSAMFRRCSLAVALPRPLEIHVTKLVTNRCFDDSGGIALPQDDVRCFANLSG
jgi:hypothetical protein